MNPEELEAEIGTVRDKAAELDRRLGSMYKTFEQKFDAWARDFEARAAKTHEAAAARALGFEKDLDELKTNTLGWLGMLQGRVDKTEEQLAALAALDDPTAPHQSRDRVGRIETDSRELPAPSAEWVAELVKRLKDG